MIDKIRLTEPVLLAGEGNLTNSIATLLLTSGHKVELCNTNRDSSLHCIRRLLSDSNYPKALVAEERLTIHDSIPADSDARFVILISPEDVTIKKELISKIEKIISSVCPIAINCENIPLSDLQDCSRHPGRIIGLNWTEPAHTTRFLEIVQTKSTSDLVVSYFQSLAVMHWNKDPYIVENTGVRNRLLAAMIREAFFLVENGYATIEDIDRACRNDAGYYLSFAGNCRYMDLMGTFGYGVVMKDLNPELSKSSELPDFFYDILQSGGEGISNGNGFYKYSKEQQELWKSTVEKFSYQIKEIIDKYPFDYK